MINLSGSAVVPGKFHRKERESIELVGNGHPNPFGRINNFSERESLENLYTGTLATELNRSVTGTRGLSCHAMSNSISLRQES